MRLKSCVKESPNINENEKFLNFQLSGFFVLQYGCKTLYMNTERVGLYTEQGHKKIKQYIGSILYICHHFYGKPTVVTYMYDCIVFIPLLSSLLDPL